MSPRSRCACFRPKCSAVSVSMFVSVCVSFVCVDACVCAPGFVDATVVPMSPFHACEEVLPVSGDGLVGIAARGLCSFAVKVSVRAPLAHAHMAPHPRGGGGVTGTHQPPCTASTCTRGTSTPSCRCLRHSLHCVVAGVSCPLGNPSAPRTRPPPPPPPPLLLRLRWPMPSGRVCVP